jgi:tetratricopeptide (TPR) repeat protein
VILFCICNKNEIRPQPRAVALITSTLPSGIDWHDARAMEPIDGPLARYPLARVLLLIHRSRASGALRIFDGETSHTFRLRDGKVIDVEGVDDLFTALVPDLPDYLELEQCIGRVMAAGHPLDQVLEEACRTLGRILATWSLEELGILSFKPEQGEGGQSFAMPWSLMAMLAHGLHSAGSTRLGQQMLDTQATDPVSALIPQGGDEQRLGLDPLSLRVLNLARARPPLQDLVARATRGNSARRRQVLHVVFMLHHVGLLHLPEPTLQTDEVTQGVPRGRRRSQPPDSQPPERRQASRSPEVPARKERRSKAPSEPSPDEQVAKLTKRIELLRTQNFYQRLGLGDAESKPTPKECDEAFHKLSKRYHPDGHGNSAEKVKDTAEEAFSLLSEAIEGLRKKRVAEEHWERNRCAQQGIPYVTDRDRTKAKMSYKKGERLFRNRDYPIAEACFNESRNKDPLNPQYAFMHAYSAFLAKQMPAEEALAIIGKLTAESMGQNADFQYTIGRIVLLSGGDRTRANKHFQKAVESNPEHRDAQRELRLNAMRTEAQPKASNIPFAGLFDRFRKKDKDKG